MYTKNGLELATVRDCASLVAGAAGTEVQRQEGAGLLEGRKTGIGLGLAVIGHLIRLESASALVFLCRSRKEGSPCYPLEAGG